jgi:hypothetical protein
MSWIFPPCLRPSSGEGRGGGRESRRWVGGWRGAGIFLSKVSFDLVGGEVGGGRAAVGLLDGRSITFVGTQCLSKVKFDLAFLS